MMITEPPPRSAMPGSAMLVSQKVLRTLAAMTRSKASSDIPAAGPK